MWPANSFGVAGGKKKHEPKNKVPTAEFLYLKIGKKKKIYFLEHHVLNYC